VCSSDLYFEIWDKGRWDEEFNNARDDFQASGQVFADLGI
jgi:DNA-binding transcriptional regulator/RsmH inhibitor MraZ